MPLPSRVTASPYALSSPSKSYPTLYYFLEEVTSPPLHVQRPTLLPLLITRPIRSWRLFSNSNILAHSQVCKSLAHIVKLAPEEISFLFFNLLAAFRFSVLTSDLHNIDITVMHTVLRSGQIQVCIDTEATTYSMNKRRISVFL
jgi:hypothetical protein